jgi:hypothetical protein
MKFDLLLHFIAPHTKFIQHKKIEWMIIIMKIKLKSVDNIIIIANSKYPIKIFYFIIFLYYFSIINWLWTRPSYSKILALCLTYKMHQVIQWKFHIRYFHFGHQWFPPTSVSTLKTERGVLQRYRQLLKEINIRISIKRTIYTQRKVYVGVARSNVGLLNVSAFRTSILKEITRWMYVERSPDC